MQLGCKPISFQRILMNNELCDRLKLILQEKQAVINSVRIIEQMVAIFDSLLEYKCITPTQHRKNFQNFWSYITQHNFFTYVNV